MRRDVRKDALPQRRVLLPAREQGSDVFGDVQRMIVVAIRLHVPLREQRVLPLRLADVQSSSYESIE